MKEASDFDVDRAIMRVQAAILESDIRAMKKSRTDYTSRSAQNKTYKPTGVSMGKVSNFNYAGPNNRTTPAFTYSGPNNRTKSNFTYSAPVAPSKKATPKSTKTTNKYGFKKNSIADKIGTSFRKAYQGK